MKPEGTVSGWRWASRSLCRLCAAPPWPAVVFLGVRNVGFLVVWRDRPGTHGRRCLVGHHRTFCPAGFVGNSGSGDRCAFLSSLPSIGADVGGVDRRVARPCRCSVSLLVATVGFGRVALTRHLHERDARRPLDCGHDLAQPGPHLQSMVRRRQGRKVLGPVQLAESLGVEVVMLDRGLDLEQLARETGWRGGADCLAMAGGDGSQALVASIAIEHDLPFRVRHGRDADHFALDLGIDREDPLTSLKRLPRDGVERRIDYATVGGPPPREQRVARDLCHDRPTAGLSRGEIRDSPRLLLPSDARAKTSEPFDLQFATCPDGPVMSTARLPHPGLDLALTRSAQRWKVLTAPKAGHGNALGVVCRHCVHGALEAGTRSSPSPRRSSGVEAGTGTSCYDPALRSPVTNRKAFAGIDGEALELGTPLAVRDSPSLVPPASCSLGDNLTVAERRRARDVSVLDLISLARESRLAADGI